MPHEPVVLPPRFLRTKEAADFLSLSARTLEKHRTYGTGPAYRKLGGRVVYAIDDLEAWTERGAVTSTSDPRGSVRPEADPRSFADVAASAPAAKQAIAALACTQIRDGEVIALDIGTTVAAMCPLLAERSLTVVTASLAVVRALASAPAIDIVVLGGLLRPNYDSLVGTLTESALRQLRVDRAFLGTAGVRADGAVLDAIGRTGRIGMTEPAAGALAEFRAGMRRRYTDEEILAAHYAEHVDKPFYPGVVDYMTSGNVVAAVAEGRRVVLETRTS